MSLRARLSLFALESRENPSGPTPIDPTDPGGPPPSDPTPAETAPPPAPAETQEAAAQNPSTSDPFVGKGDIYKVPLTP